ncbi:MAG: hypothetical protein ABIQ90_07595 [Polaromonas sp.]
MKNILIASLLLSSSMLALAKPPALSAEAKAKSDEAAAKVAWSAKVNAYQLCQSQDKVAATYYKTTQAAGKQNKPPVATPPCSDPGPFSYAASQSPKPLEVSGAHSPADTAVAPPSSKAVDAVINPDKKP